MPKIFIGVDMGVTGAISIIDDKKEVVATMSLPFDKNGLKAKGLYSFIDYHLKGIKHSEVIIRWERQFVPKGQGNSEPIFHNSGEVVSILKLFSDKVIRTQALEWVKAYNLTSTKKTHTDKAFKEFGMKLDPKKSKEHGLADSLLIALYALDMENSKNIF